MEAKVKRIHDGDRGGTVHELALRPSQHTNLSSCKGLRNNYCRKQQKRMKVQSNQNSHTLLVGM